MQKVWDLPSQLSHNRTSCIDRFLDCQCGEKRFDRSQRNGVFSLR
jgi:hypothetical protein